MRHAGADLGQNVVPQTRMRKSRTYIFSNNSLAHTTKIF